MTGGLANLYRKFFGDPHAVVLAIFLLALALMLWFFGGMLIPVLASLVIAYLLEVPVQRLSRLGMSRFVAVLIIFSIFMAVVILLLVGLVPLLSGQIKTLVSVFPRIVQNLLAGIEQLLLYVSELLPSLFKDAEVITELDIENGVGGLVDVGTPLSSVDVSTAPELLQQSKDALTDLLVFASKGFSDALSYLLSFFSLRSVMKAITLLVYVVLMPILVFFFLMDKEKILNWFGQFMPVDNLLIKKVWHEVDLQIGNYVRGKCVEIVIVGSVTFVVFVLLDVRFAALLGVIVGFSVLIPYVGATVATLPVFILGYAQFGWSPQLAWLMVAYGIIQLLDGNVLVPLLFSEVVDLHPIAIIVAVLIFGGLWGFWGVFFAIPLGTLVQAVLRSWPRATHALQKEQQTDCGV